MVSLIRLGTVLPVSMIRKAGTAHTRPFYFRHGIDHTPVSLSMISLSFISVESSESTLPCIPIANLH